MDLLSCSQCFREGQEVMTPQRPNAYDKVEVCVL
jgi:hypothetical protein